MSTWALVIKESNSFIVLLNFYTHFPSGICLIEHESNRDTKVVKRNPNGFASYGLFQISSKEWCRVSRKGGICDKKCEGTEPLIVYYSWIKIFFCFNLQTSSTTTLMMMYSVRSVSLSVWVSKIGPVGLHPVVIRRIYLTSVWHATYRQWEQLVHWTIYRSLIITLCLILNRCKR